MRAGTYHKRKFDDIDELAATNTEVPDLEVEISKEEKKRLKREKKEKKRLKKEKKEKRKLKQDKDSECDDVE